MMRRGRERGCGVLLSVAFVTAAYGGGAKDDFASAMLDDQSATSRFEYQAAISAYEKAIQFDARSAAAHIGLANTLMQSALGPMFPGVAETLKRAENEEQAALGLEPNNAEALAGLGEVQYRLGLPARGGLFTLSTTIVTAKETLAKALAADPKNYHAHYQLARIAGAEFGSRFLHAMAAAGMKFGVKQEFPPGLKEKIRSDDGPILEQGMEHAKKAIAAQENSTEAMHELSGLYYMKSLIAETPDEEQADLKLRDEWQARSQQANALRQRGVTAATQPTIEVRNFSEAMAAGTRSTEAFQYESAVRAFKKAVQFDDRSVEAHVLYGRALIRTSDGNNSSYPYDAERLQQGLKEEQRALDLDGHDADAMAEIGAAILASGSFAPQKADRFAAARDWEKKALAADAKNYRANYLMAFIAYQEAGGPLFDASSTAYERGVRDGSLPLDLREPLKQRYGALVDEGIRCGQAALTVQPGSYLAMWELVDLLSWRHDVSAEPSKADAEMAKEFRTKAFQLVPKEDPEGSMIRSISMMPPLLPPPPPPPPSAPPVK
jgi:cytochrome c-type biogenesis protein CcmH/NrfG